MPEADSTTAPSDELRAADGPGGRPPDTSDPSRTGELIDRWIVPNPHRPGEDDVCIRGFGVPVWAIIGHSAALGLPTDDAQAAAPIADDYGVPVEAVWAALAYYQHHQRAIDSRLAANET